LQKATLQVKDLSIPQKMTVVHKKGALGAP
jgi:hypothetical protein